MAEDIIANDHQAEGLKLINEAGMQLEMLSKMLLAELARLGVFEGEGIKSAIIRIKDLSGVVVTALDQFDEDHLRELRSTVHGI